MFVEAAGRHQIDLEASWVIGDRTADIKAAENIGARVFWSEPATQGAIMSTLPGLSSAQMIASMRFGSLLT